MVNPKKGQGVKRTRVTWSPPPGFSNPAWYLINEGKITAQGENQEYTIEDSGDPEITYNISINDGVLNLTGFGEGAEVDVYDIDDKCRYLTIDYILSMPIEEIKSKRYRYVSANGVELYFDQKD